MVLNDCVFKRHKPLVKIKRKMSYEFLEEGFLSVTFSVRKLIG